MSMIHHISLPVANLEASTTFYDAVLTELGYRQVSSSPGFTGYGLVKDKDQFSLIQINPSATAGRCFHLAFAAPTREAVDQFYSAALENGGVSNGASGLRLNYGKDYYAAFIIDPDGHRIEAVINVPIND